MEEEKAEGIKSYNDLLSSGNIVSAAKVVVGVGFLVWNYPWIVSLVEVAIGCFDWFRLIWSYGNYLSVVVLLNILILVIFRSFWKTTEKSQPDLYDEYVAAVPTVIRASPEYNYRVTEVEDNDDDGCNNYWCDKEAVPVKESCCCDRVIVEVNSKSYRRTRSEKKTEYRRTESERVTKTASWKSQSMDGMSSEEFRMTIETFITQKKMMLNGVDQWQNDVPVRQNALVDQWRRGVTQCQGSSDNGTDRHRQRQRQRSRTHRPLPGSASTSYLAISN